MTLHLKVEVTALSNYETQEEEFKKEVPFYQLLLCFKELFNFSF